MKEFSSNEVWMRASVTGSLWAAFEIVIGSFLHNLHFPFTGMVMSSIGVILLISFSVLWKMKGVFWRAALICALMKSISPSAVILGPMIGIMLEGLMIQFSIAILGRNIVGYLFGGILAVLSILIHKAGGLLISYGFDFVVILDNMLAFVLKAFSIKNVEPVNVLFYYAGLLALVGAFAASFAFYIGYKARYLKSGTKTFIEISEQNQRKFEESESKGVQYLFIVIFLVILSLFLISGFGLEISLISSSLFFLLCIIYYPAGFKVLFKPSVLLNLGILLVISIFIYDYKHSGFGWTEIGFIVGLKLLLRAAIVLIGFAVISIELRNPIVKNFLSAKGGSVVYYSLQTGFSILPSMIAGLPTIREMYSKPVKSISTKIVEADTFIQTQIKNG